VEREGVVMGGMPWLLLLVVVVAGCGHREEVEKEGVVRRGRPGVVVAADGAHQ